MRKLYERNELTFAIVWIVIYCVVQSLANSLNEQIGIEYSASAVFCVLQTAILLAFLWKNKLLERYGLCKSMVPARSFYYYVPLFIQGDGKEQSKICNYRFKHHVWGRSSDQSVQWKRHGFSK